MYVRALKALYQFEYLERKQSEPGSVGHGEAMDILVNKVETPYFVTLDCDATFLRAGWDEHLISQMSSTIKAAGTQASGNKPSDFPLMYGVLYETEAFKSMNVKFLPPLEMDKNGVLKDTGWEIREKYLATGHSGYVLEALSTRDNKKGPFGDMIVMEYYAPGDPKIFASHFGRGSTLGGAKYLKASLATKFLGKIHARIKGHKERIAWIRRVKSLVRNEAKNHATSEMR